MFKPARRILVPALMGLATLSLSLAPIATAQAHHRHAHVMTTSARTEATDENRYAAIVMDASNGEIIFEKNADALRHPASITKIMTLYLTFEALADGRLKLDDRVPVSRHAASMAPSKLGVAPGGSVSVDQAMRAVAVISANDMAVALAEKLAGSEPRFTALMTVRARELGMANTQYVNANGLPDPRQISSAHDIAILSRAVMRDFPQYYGYFSLKSFTYDGRTETNHNHLLASMPGVDGLKTGFINASGFNLSASAVRDNHRLIAVVLGGQTAHARDEHVRDLLDTGFDFMHRRDLGEKVLASNLFSEPSDLPGAAAAGPAGKIVLSDAEVASLQAASAPASHPQPQPAAAPPKPVVPAAPRLIKAKADAGSLRHRRDGQWRVQVGVYGRRSEASAQLDTMTHQYADAFNGAERRVIPAEHGRFDARFLGFSEASAKDACRALKAGGESCLALPPES